MLTNAPALLHVVGYLTGASLYALLLAMVLQTRGPGYRLTLGTALLGLAWNIGELSAHMFDGLGVAWARDSMSAVSYGALGFLAAVAVHSAGRGPGEDDEPLRRGRARLITRAAYACAGVASVMQLFAAATGLPLPWPAALVLLTIGLAVLAPVLLWTTRRQAHVRRAVWMTALSLFAVSAMHIGRFHGASESWPIELLGHHASIPLAFAILYQDYRFAFADLFLKRALTLLALVTVVFTAWSLLEPSLADESSRSPAIGILLTLWVATALLFPWLRDTVSSFVDRIVLKRADYSKLLDSFASSIQRCATEKAAVEHACAALAAALSPASVTVADGAVLPVAAGYTVPIPTAEAPQILLVVGSLGGGRRLLSDDTATLERIALMVGRRIDALRLIDERYERVLREREISALATEAELRALRAQINPHFLFNALTTVGYLIQSAPARALDTLLRLTTLLRSVLRPEGEFTTLGHEQDLIECYLQIERERFEERLEAHVEIPRALAALPIPSLIVQPLVENAIKHGIARVRDGGRVTVQAHFHDGPSPHLQILVTNTGASLGDASSGGGAGIGLQNVRRRLECYYGDRATLTLKRSATGETVAELTLPTLHAPGDDDAPDDHDAIGEGIGVGTERHL